MKSVVCLAPSQLSELSEEHIIKLSAPFIQSLTHTDTLESMLSILARWLPSVIQADRASIALKNNSQELLLWAIAGNQAIPATTPVPIAGTMVGKTFTEKQILVCEDLSTSRLKDCQKLCDWGLGSCMDAPLLLQDNRCIGTLNVAHKQPGFYTKESAAMLYCLARWTALHIKLHYLINYGEIEGNWPENLEIRSPPDRLH